MIEDLGNNTFECEIEPRAISVLSLVRSGQVRTGQDRSGQDRTGKERKGN
jgi:hypothetical protein